jgi:hypothetical protein
MAKPFLLTVRVDVRGLFRKKISGASRRGSVTFCNNCADSVQSPEKLTISTARRYV